MPGRQRFILYFEHLSGAPLKHGNIVGSQNFRACCFVENGGGNTRSPLCMHTNIPTYNCENIHTCMYVGRCMYLCACAVETRIT